MAISTFVAVGTVGRASANTCTTGAGTTVAGDVLAAFVEYDATAGTITVAGDNKGNTFTPVGTPQADNAGGLSRWYVCATPTSLGTSHTFTFTTSNSHFGTVHFFRIAATGTLSFITPPTQQVTNNSAGVPAWTLAVPSVLAGDLVLTGVANNTSGNGAFSTTTGSVLSAEIDSSTYWSSSVIGQIAAASGTYTASVTNSTKANGTPTSMVGLVVREASGGGGGGGAVIINSFF